MNKKLKWTLIIVGIIAALFVAMNVMKHQAKKISPETTVEYSKNNTNISISYSRPFKKNRTIFDSLVPYGKVWRTGANEPTIFRTNQDLLINGKTLSSGNYTLWTIPEKDNWTVIFNKKQYGWGVKFSGEVSREADADVLSVKVPVVLLDKSIEQFTISILDIDGLVLSMEWDKTSIKLPLIKKQ